MRFFGLMAAAGVCCVMSGAAVAADYPDLLGVWKGTSEAVVIGDPRHYLADADAEVKPHLASADFTLTLTGQDGRRLWGTIATGSDSEPWLAVFHNDGKSFDAVDADGHAEGRLQHPDQFELCYVHTGATMVASCAELTRQ